MTDEIFKACGLKECKYQIPYDMAEHERMIYQQGRQDVIDEAHKFCGKNDDTEYCVECALSMFKDNEFIGCYLDKMKEQTK